MYWIDPNSGSTNDAIFVYCTFDSLKEKVETCLYPLKTRYDVRNWVHHGDDGYRWFVGDILSTPNEKV